MLDYGTNNEALLEDPLYIGLRQKRLSGSALDELVDEFVEAAQQSFPGIVIQFEDFANHNAFRLLRNYRDKICCFNDDIQGTASVTVAGIFSALRVTGKRMSEQTFLSLGAGEAATGIADLLVAAMMDDGLDEATARSRCWMVDSKGLVVAERKDLAEHKRPYAHPHVPVADFLGAVRALEPTALIGVGATPQAFDRDVIEAMSRLNQRPIIFALSNPTSKAECTAEQAYAWSGGRALFASGSPFDPVELDGRRYVPRQGNNSYIFPGVGLGVVTVQSSRVTDAMFMAAARTLAHSVSEEDLAQGSLYPALSRVREVSAQIAVAVAEVAFRDGLACIDRPGDLHALMLQQMYDARYVSFVP
jgi:malate dehydrogenase (oxaloacetate-decarboxylating)(NADP+)